MGQVIALRDCQLFELHAEDLAYLSHVGHRQRSVRQQVLEVGRQLLDAEIAGQYRRMAPPGLRPMLAGHVANRALQFQRMGRNTPNNTIQVRVKVARSEEHTSELQSLMRISYAVFCLKKKKKPSQRQSNRATQH